MAVVSETSEQQPTQSEFEKAATDWVKQNVAPDHEITVTFVSYEDPAAVQAFTTRLAAGAIQAVIFLMRPKQTCGSSVLVAVSCQRTIASSWTRVCCSNN